MNPDGRCSKCFHQITRTDGICDYCVLTGQEPGLELIMKEYQSDTNTYDPWSDESHSDPVQDLIDYKKALMNCEIRENYYKPEMMSIHIHDKLVDRLIEANVVEWMWTYALRIYFTSKETIFKVFKHCKDNNIEIPKALEFATYDGYITTGEESAQS